MWCVSCFRPEGSANACGLCTTAVAACSATLPYQSLFLSLSHARVAAYSAATDSDSTDAIARYLWNMALAAALQPLLHMAEVAFRNALFDVGQQTTSGRNLTFRTVACWLGIS